MPKKELGFTLIELLIVTTIAGIVGLAAVPLYTDMITKLRGFSAATALRSSLRMAYSEAVRKHTVIRLCASSDGEYCSENKYWEEGWIIYTDLAGETTRTNSDPIISHQSSFNRITIRKKGRYRTVKIKRNGRIGTNDSFSICAKRNVSTPIYRVAFIHSGRARITEDEILCK